MEKVVSGVGGFATRGSPHPDRRCSYPIGDFGIHATIPIACSMPHRDFGIHASRLGNAGIFEVFGAAWLRKSPWILGALIIAKLENIKSLGFF